MIEIVGDFWELAPDYEALVCTTNGIIRADGKLTMGAGIALDFANRFPTLPKWLGERVKFYGNHCHMVTMNRWIIVSFPTKENWKNPSIPSLIERSTQELVNLVNQTKIKSVLCTRFGAGCGKLDWVNVRKIVEPLLDNRFMIVDRKAL